MKKSGKVFRWSKQVRAGQPHSIRPAANTNAKDNEVLELSMGTVSKNANRLTGVRLGVLTGKITPFFRQYKTEISNYLEFYQL